MGFNSDNPVWRTLGVVGDLILLNWLFLLCAIPIVTIGPALTATHHVALQLIRGEDPAVIKAFFAAFKSNFKQSIALWLIMLLVLAMLFINFFVGSKTLSAAAWTALVVAEVIVAVVWLLELIYAFPLMARYENTLAQTLKSALILAVAYLPRTLVMLVLTLAAPVMAFVSQSFWTTLLMLATFLLFSGVPFACDILVNRIFVQSFPHEREAQKK